VVISEGYYLLMNCLYVMSRKLFEGYMLRSSFSALIDAVGCWLGDREGICSVISTAAAILISLPLLLETGQTGNISRKVGR